MSVPRIMPIWSQLRANSDAAYLCPLPKCDTRHDLPANERRVGHAGRYADCLSVIFRRHVGDSRRRRQPHSCSVNRRTTLLFCPQRRFLSAESLVCFRLCVEEVGQRLVLEEEPGQERVQEADQEAVQDRREHSLLCRWLSATTRAQELAYSLVAVAGVKSPSIHCSSRARACSSLTSPSRPSGTSSPRLS